MPRPRVSIPKLAENSRGYLYSRDLDGNQVWFGHKSKPEGAQRYAQFLADIQRGRDVGRPTKPAAPSLARPRVNEVCLRFMTDYCPRYKTSSGEPSAEIRCFQGVIRILRGLYGNTVADNFGPLALRSVRDVMIEKGWSRKFVNKQVIRLRLIFRVGVSWELVRAEVLAGLDSVPSLAIGETEADDQPERFAVPLADVEAVRVRLRQRNRDLLDLLMATGARPGELRLLTPSMIDQKGEIWRCELTRHKTAHRGKRRLLLFNATAQEILSRYMKGEPTQRIFTMRSDTFSAAIREACKRAKVTPFVPHQIRHTVATRLADEADIEQAQQLLGHSTAAMTRHYSRAATKKAESAVRKLK